MGPLIWAPLSDKLGRRFIYMATLTIFGLNALGCGLSPNINLLIMFRLLQSLGGSAIVSIGAGTISDIFPIAERARALSLYFFAPQLGVSVGYVGVVVCSCNHPMKILATSWTCARRITCSIYKLEKYFLSYKWSNVSGFIINNNLCPRNFSANR